MSRHLERFERGSLYEITEGIYLDSCAHPEYPVDGSGDVFTDACQVLVSLGRDGSKYYFVTLKLTALTLPVTEAAQYEHCFKAVCKP